MFRQIVLFHCGSWAFTLRSLTMLVCLGAYAAVCLVYCAPKCGVKRERAVWALLCAYAGMFLAGKAGYLLLDRNAPKNLLASGDMTFAGIAGFFAALRLYCLRSPKAFKKLLKLYAPPFFSMAAALYIFRDGTAGIVAARGGLFRYTDGYGLHRWDPSLLQGTLLLLLMAVSWALQKATGKRHSKEKGQSRTKHRFKIKLLPMTLTGLSLLLPVELVRDSTQVSLWGVRAEALLVWVAFIALLAVYLNREISERELPGRIKLINAAAALLFPVLSFAALCNDSAVLCVIFCLLPVCATLSPLYPFMKRPGRLTKQRRRRFS